jgi:hypothetical protein
MSSNSSDKINGCRVVAQFSTPGGRMTRPGRLVLVDRGYGLTDRWVSAWIGDGDSEWSHGHYFGDWLDARAHFLDACSREQW